MKLAVVIPAYNEEKTIGSLVLKVWEKLATLKAQSQISDYEIIVVDDGSTDRTAEIVKKVGATLLQHEKNKGKGAAKNTGWFYAIRNGFEYILNMDADGQHSPDDIPKFIQAIHDTRADIVLPKREFTLRKMKLPRFLANHWQSLAASVRTGERIYDSQCDFRLLRRDVLKHVLEKLKISTSKFEAETELLIKALRSGFKHIVHVDVETIYIKGRKSRINPVIDTIKYLYLLVRSLTWG